MIIECRSKFIEKVVTDSFGQSFRAVFLVAIVGGEVKARLVSLQPISKQALALTGTVTAGNNVVLCLPAWTAQVEIETPYLAPVAPCVSPYFDLDILLSTQPTRAPANF